MSKTRRSIPVFWFFLFLWIQILPILPGFGQTTENREFPNVLNNIELLSRIRPDSAYIQLQDMLAKPLSNDEQALCHQQMGRILFNNSHFTQAIEHLMTADRLFRDGKDKLKLAANLNDLGRLYYANKQPDLASRLFEEALQINLQEQHVSGTAQTYGNIGHLYEKKLQYDSARYFQYKALTLFRSVGDEKGMAKIYENLGSIFEDGEQYDSAYAYFIDALTINQQFRDEIAQIEIFNNLGDVYRKTGRYEEGLKFSFTALQLAKKTASQYQLASAYRDMARGYEFLHRFDSAYVYNEMSRELVEEIYSSSNNRQIALLETMYEVEKKNNQITQLALDKKLNTILAIAGGLVLLLLSILGIVIISRQRLKIRNEKALNERNTHIYETNRELMQSELKNQLLEEDKLRSSLEARSRELSTHTLHLIQKNQLLEELRNQLNEIAADEKRDQKRQIKQLAQKINVSFVQDKYWDDFRAIFDQVHQTFFANLKKQADTLTPAEMRLIALLRMNLNSSDIATLLAISQDSLRVARYRLKKKLNISEGESLTTFIQNL